MGLIYGLRHKSHDVLPGMGLALNWAKSRRISISKPISPVGSYLNAFDAVLIFVTRFLYAVASYKYSLLILSRLDHSQLCLTAVISPLNIEPIKTIASFLSSRPYPRRGMLLCN